jgi:hypothetical protein
MKRYDIFQRYWVFMLATACSAVAQAGFQYIPVDLSPHYNVRRQVINPNFPEGNLVLGGVPFVIPIGGNNEWTCTGTHSQGAGPQFDGTYVLDIPVGIYGLTNAYTLITTHWGTSEPGHLKIEFFGSSDGYYAKDLLGNEDIRDWNLYFTNRINGTSSVNVFSIPQGADGSPDVMDMQIFTLPMSFQDEYLSTIRFTENRVYMHHQAILSGITVAIPEPATCLFLGLGIVILQNRKP